MNLFYRPSVIEIKKGKDMEIIAIMMIVLLSLLFIKVFVHLGIFVITLPFKILIFFISALLVIFLLIPLGVIAGLAAVLIAPFALMIPVLPLILIIVGLVLLFKD